MDWDHFTRQEFACQHCGRNAIDDRLIDVLQRIRHELGLPMKVTSGYRCPEHPIEARKAQPGSHATGMAADIGVSHKAAFDLLAIAMRQPEITGIGVNQKGRGRFIHLDIAPAAEGRPRPHIWSY